MRVFSLFPSPSLTHILLHRTRFSCPLTPARTENVAIDLENFSAHAGRTTVTTDDVLLLARKNPDLHQLMEEFIEARKAKAGKGKGRAARK